MGSDLISDFERKGQGASLSRRERGISVAESLIPSLAGVLERVDALDSANQDRPLRTKTAAAIRSMPKRASACHESVGTAVTPVIGVGVAVGGPGKGVAVAVGAGAVTVGVGVGPPTG